MDMHLGCCLFDRQQQISVVEGVEIARQAALDTYFSSATFPCFDGSTPDLFERVKVSVLFARRPAKGTEAASNKTDVGEVDISIDDVGDHITNAFSPDAVSRQDQSFHLRAAGLRKQ